MGDQQASANAQGSGALINYRAGTCGMGIRGANQIHPGLDAMDRLVALELAAKRRRQGNDRQRPTE